jgi:small subunit ribosomal protein S16
MRMGKKKQPTYRIVAADSRSPRDGRFLEIIGTYNPRTEPSGVKVDNDAAVRWLRNGARPSEAVEKLLKISGAWGQFTGEAPPADAASAPAEEPAPAATAEADEPETTGDGSHPPLPDGSMPEGYPIKGTSDPMLFHAPGSRFYEATEAEIWFAGIDAATAAGYRPATAQAIAEAEAESSADSDSGVEAEIDADSGVEAESGAEAGAESGAEAGAEADSGAES